MSAMSRRSVGRAAVGMIAGILHSSRALAKSAPFVQPRPIARVIVDNDFAGDPDGLAALAYQLLAPTARTVLITSSALDARLAALAGSMPPGRTALKGAILARELIGIARLKNAPAVVSGSETFGTGPEQVTDAARAIVAEARRPDALPLVVTCGGPLTNVAAALRIDPSLAQRMTIIWIGGHAAQASGEEYNQSTDTAATRQIIENSDVPFWQVPVEAYGSLLVSRTELIADLRPISPLTMWLYDRLADMPSFVPPSGNKGMGDCALVPLASVSGECGRYSVQPAKRIVAQPSDGELVPGRSVRIYSELDHRLIIADMLASFRLQTEQG